MKIIDATNPTLTKIEGIVIDETKNMVKIRSKKGDKLVPKEVVTFRITLPSRKAIDRSIEADIEGRVLVDRPEDRVKMKVRYW